MIGPCSLDWKTKMNVVSRILPNAAFLILMTGLFTLSACDGVTVTPSIYGADMVLASPAPSGIVCEICAQATLAAAQTLDQNSANNQAALDAGIVRANAQATLDSANATLGVALTQAQNNANVVAAQIAATAAVEYANAQATLNSADLTQIAAMTQSQYNLQSTMAVGTQDVLATITQQSKNDFAAATQTTIANTIATQTQSAAATSQWYDDQARQREEQRQGPIAFLWMWCLPVFVLLLAGLILWGFWRWMKIQQFNQLTAGNTAAKLTMPASEILDHHQRKSLTYVDGDSPENDYQVTTPDDQVSEWMDEVKAKLLRSEEKDKDDNADS
jgi:hypothetical protein